MSDAPDIPSLRAGAQHGQPAAQEQLGAVLLKTARFGSNEFDEALHWIRQAADQGAATAQLRLGHIYAQNPALDDAPAHAAHYYEAAARARPDALERLADLHLRGYGVERDPVRALGLLQQVAALGYPPAQCHVAYLLSQGEGAARDQLAASGWYLRAAAQGDTGAMAVLGERYRVGAGVPADPVAAVAWMQLAVLRQLPGAEDRLQVLVGEASAAEQAAANDLAEAIKSNIRGLGAAVAALGDPATLADYSDRFNALIESHFAKLDRPQLAIDNAARAAAGAGDYTHQADAPQYLSGAPRVIAIDGFAAPEECHLLIHQAQPHLRDTRDARQQDMGIEVDAFDGACAVISAPLASPVDRCVVDRFSRLCHLPFDHFEPVSVLRYGVGHEYSPHYDYFEYPRIARQEAVGDWGGQRLATCLLHLRAAHKGGATRYERAGLDVEERMGLGVIHYNARPNALPDPDSLHAGLPIEAGEKWLLRTSGRECSLFRPVMTQLD